jgi:hypothetical protein
LSLELLETSRDLDRGFARQVVASQVGLILAVAALHDPTVLVYLDALNHDEAYGLDLRSFATCP